MPSIIEGYEFDIFVSYRQKDNRRDGWVTHFVKNLEHELASTFKEDIGVYFDFNPKTGLKETHHVDDSLSNKIKSIIFIPILSQTYCDPTSFAWQNEFLPFKKMASEDEYGLKVKLPNGYVSSRVLPVRIHDLDPEDLQMIEGELGQLRSIDFVFESHGVNRPLLPIDTKNDNLNKTVYRDQVNKLANAIKEIIYGIKYPNRISKEQTKTEDEQLSQFDRSIAVLPFLCLTGDRTQEYIGDSITENIILQLASLKELKIISRTSVLKYKNSAQSVPEIANELGVKYVIEGSVQLHKNKARITIQFIDAELENHLWVKVFDEHLDDLFVVQSKVSEEVTKELQLTLNPEQRRQIEKKPTNNSEAYELFLKGRHAFNSWSVIGYRKAEKYFLRALELDPEYADAWSYLASCYSGLISWNGDLSVDEGLPKLTQYLKEAWSRGPTENDYLTKAFVEFFVNKNFGDAVKYLTEAIEIAPNNSTLYFITSYVLNMQGKHEEAFEYVEKGKKIDPVSISYFNFLGVTQLLSGKVAPAISTFIEALEFFPNSSRQIDHLVHAYILAKEYENVISTTDDSLKVSHQLPPSTAAYRAIAFLKLGQRENADKIIEELNQRYNNGEKGISLPLAQIYFELSDLKSANFFTKKAHAFRDIQLIWKEVDPVLIPLIEQYQKSTTPDFEGAENYISNQLKDQLDENLTYHSYYHSEDVVKVAADIARELSLSEEEINILRIAGWLHDSGFLRSYNNHEEYGCEIAKEVLPRFNFSEEIIEKICGMIMATKIPQSPKSELEMILCDADLDYLGRDDYEKIAENLFQEFMNYKRIKDRKEWNKVQKDFMQKHFYHTELSKNRREMKKLQNLLTVFESSDA